MTKTFSHLFSAWRHNRDGIAATEFAILMPVLVILFFGVVEASNAMMVNRKVAISANTLADLAAQSEQLYLSDLDDLFEGVTTIIEPNDTTSMKLNLISVTLDSEGDPIVHWSRSSDGGEPYSAGAYYTTLKDDDVLSAKGSLIVVEMSYTYIPGLTSFFIDAPIQFTRESIRWPRVTNRVQLCDANDNCTT